MEESETRNDYEFLKFKKVDLFALKNVQRDNRARIINLYFTSSPASRRYNI